MGEPNRIKLQMVLTPAARTGREQEKLRSKLEDVGITMTGQGLATASGEITQFDLEKHWNLSAATRSGFSPIDDRSFLRVPAGLDDCIVSISLVPRHTAFEE